VVSNVLKGYWWRLNGMGYFWGMLVGIVGALAFPPLFAGLLADVASDISPLYLFPLLLLVSGLACVIGSLLTAPENPELLKEFYRTVRPWGLWGPVHRQVIAEDPEFRRNEDFGRDMFNVAVGIIAQTCLVAAPIFLVIREHSSLAATLAVFFVSATILKKTWFDRLERAVPDATA
jgi:MFS family permease